MNKTIKSVNNIYNALTSITTRVDPTNRDESVQENIQRFKDLNKEYQSQLSDNFNKMTVYIAKYKQVNKTHSKEYFNKKINKYKQNCHMLFERVNSTQGTIDRLTKLLESSKNHT